MKIKVSLLIGTNFLSLLSGVQPTVCPYYGTNLSVDAVLVMYSVKRINGKM